MAELRLTAVSRSQGNNADLKAGVVAPSTCSLDFEEVPVLVHAFRRMVRELSYDVCELAFTTYLCAKAHGARFTALPIFLVRDLHHGAILHDTTRPSPPPSDLAGRRIGVNRGYTVTTGVWARAILQDEYGVDLDTVTWVRSDEEHVAGYRPPPNVEDLHEGEDLSQLLLDGHVDAVVGGLKTDDERIGPLLPDADEAGFQALAERDLYPINHLVVVRDDLLAEHPGLAADLFEAFAASKRRYVERLEADELEAPTRVDAMHRRVMELTGGDPLPYGIAPNRAMIDELLRHAVTQHILDRPPTMEELFAAGTHELIG
ncbi:ABC transporter substrate-binding protein [Egicoccus sp. AB-alg6-2]|uniref:ABC transporter substrate-binding protein n=1 Tax=Egicoccus sp. AB-alg6-2 TaxID=3242692 RepID=UPI00359CC842